MYLGKKVRISNDNKKGLGTANGHIEPLWIGQESKVIFHVIRQELIGWTYLHKWKISYQDWEWMDQMTC